MRFPLTKLPALPHWAALMLPLLTMLAQPASAAVAGIERRNLGVLCANARHSRPRYRTPQTLCC